MLEVIDISGVATFQDSGRRGYQSFGVPVSGPMDWFAHQVANQLVGNSENSPVIEIGLGEATFRTKRDCVLAMTGAGFEVQNYLWTFPLWTSFYVRAGWVVQIKKTSGGNWAYLAIAGGYDVPKVLGSSSSYTRAGVGNVIQVGNLLQTSNPPTDLMKLAARDFPVQKYIQYSQTPTIEVISGPQRERFDNTFFENEYTLSKSFDRMGYRLEGKTIESSNKTELISEGMTMSSIQITNQGQPIVMMADSPTTGGYPKIANVIRADLPLLAQCEAGNSKIRFKEINLEEAQEKYRVMMKGIQNGK